jgi:hypothetical protein
MPRGKRDQFAESGFLYCEDGQCMAGKMNADDWFTNLKGGYAQVGIDAESEDSRRLMKGEEAGSGRIGYPSGEWDVRRKDGIEVGRINASPSQRM